MNIVCFGFSDICGILTALANAVNTQTDNHMQVFVREQDSFSPDGAQLFDKDIIAKALESADVIHYSAVEIDRIRREFKIDSDLYLEVYHAHGTDYRKPTNSLYRPTDGTPTLVSTPDLLQFVPDNTYSVWLPSPFDTDNLNGIDWDIKRDEFTICHATTHGMTIKDYLRRIKLPEQRMAYYGFYGSPEHGLMHSDYIKKVCKKNSIPFENVYRMSYYEGLKARSSCHFHFDGMFLGSYGQAMIESLAMGMVGMLRMSDICYHHYRDACKLDIPFINVTEKTFIDKYREAIADPDKWQRMADNCRGWGNQVHGDENVARIYNEFIEECYNDRM